MSDWDGATIKKVDGNTVTFEKRGKVANFLTKKVMMIYVISAFAWGVVVGVWSVVLLMGLL